MKGFHLYNSIWSSKYLKLRQVLSHFVVEVTKVWVFWITFGWLCVCVSGRARSRTWIFYYNPYPPSHPASLTLSIIPYFVSITNCSALKDSEAIHNHNPTNSSLFYRLYLLIHKWTNSTPVLTLFSFKGRSAILENGVKRTKSKANQIKE